jgi:uncharacterized protein (TIGR00255 family)
MTLSSMTGFARSEGSNAGASWHWEVRSVNGRGLELRLRLPPGFEVLEPRVREAAGRRLARGSIAISLNVQRDTTVSQIRLNEAVLGQVLSAIERIRGSGEFERPRPDTILGLRGVLEIAEREEDETQTAVQHNAVMGSFDLALDGLIEARAAEGRRLEPVLLSQLASIELVTDKVAKAPARSPEAIRARLKEQLGRLLDADPSLDETRLYQEAALLAQRADVDEELDRLRAHVAAARELIASSRPVGRKLDFLAQEFNREANTLCSKSNDVDVTRLGLELKAVIDQMREQVQNIE